MGRIYTTFIGYQPPIRTTTQGISETVTWTNDATSPMYVIGGRLWYGVDIGGVTDGSYRFFNATSGDIYLWSNWDHYKDPTGMPDNHDDFDLPSGDYFLVSPNDVIAFEIAGIAYPQFSPAPNISAMAYLRWKASVN